MTTYDTIAQDESAYRPPRRKRLASIHRYIREAAHDARQRGHRFRWTIQRSAGWTTAVGTCRRCGRLACVTTGVVPGVTGSAFEVDCQPPTTIAELAQQKTLSAHALGVLELIPVVAEAVKRGDARVAAVAGLELGRRAERLRQEDIP